jgi:nitrous oxidase accessory protein
MIPYLCSLLFLCAPLSLITAKEIRTVSELTAAAEAATEGTVLQLAAGTYKLSQPLELKPGVSLSGVGAEKTIITHTDEWKADPATLPDSETNHKKFDRTGYLIHCAKDGKNITLSRLTLTGPQMHGAIYGWANEGLHLHDLHIRHFMYNGLRTYIMSKAKIHDCTFTDVGFRWEKGKLGLKGGNTGGGIFAIWMSDTEIWNNRFLETRSQSHEHYYGIKGREARRVRIHHNTIEAGFTIELPFEGDEDVEIDHNILRAAVSIPKYAGGPVPKSGRTFHIHHNYFTDSYSIEFVRNGVEISHNLFDFDVAKDHGNLIAGFGKAAAKGPAVFHNNLVSNPGRGVIWINEPYSNLEVRNNHIIARTTSTPRQEGLFGFNDESEFATFRFCDNIIECEGTPRPLFRNDASGASVVENNKLTNVTDTSRYANTANKKPQGLEKPLLFECGVKGELTVDGWKTRPSTSQKAPGAAGKTEGTK